MADDAHFLALGGLKHCQRVDDSGKRVGVERSETFIDKKVPEADVAGRQGRKSQRQAQGYDESFTPGERGRIADIIGPVVIDYEEAQRIFYLLQLLSAVELPNLHVGMLHEKA